MCAPAQGMTSNTPTVNRRIQEAEVAQKSRQPSKQLYDNMIWSFLN